MYKKIILMLCMALCLGFASQAIGQLDLSAPLSVDLTGTPDQSLTIPLNLTNPTSALVDDFGLTFVYPTNLLEFQNCSQTGTLTSGWDFFGCSENTPGEIIIGAADIPGTNGAGVLLNVVFKELGNPGAGLLQLQGFVDDLATATTEDGTLNNPVPVELASFSAQVSQNSVKLGWTTATESNNFGFDIERSFDGDVFSKIGFVQGQGTTVVPQHYVFEDNEIDLADELHYYRLKQIDTDGSFEYSVTIKVELLSPETFVLRQNYPNPFNPGTLISYQIPLSSKVTLVIYNLQGQVVRTLVNEEVSRGFHNVIWNGKDDFGKSVATGVYVYRMSAHKFVDAKSLTLMR